MNSASQLLGDGVEVDMKALSERVIYTEETGAIGYILMWLMGVPAGLLFLVFLVRGCN